jgi:hypothetical protein
MKSSNALRAPSRRGCDLGANYRAIGISAVVAALRYQGERRNPGSAPAPQDERRDVTQPSGVRR